jgi:N-acetylmuramoyl-L-alanine amidase
MRKITDIIVHCSASPDNRDVDAAEIRKWHVEGNGWNDIGYHYVIKRSGQVEVGRPVEKIGSHCVGANSQSIGICLVGEKKFTEEQFTALKVLVASLKKRFPGVKISGHRDWPSAKAQGKTCPNFDVSKVL